MIYTYSTHNDTDILCIYMYDWTVRWMYAIQIDTVQPWYSAELWIIVYRCCGNCFVCLTSSTSRLSFAEFLGKAEPSGGGSRSQWVLHLTRLTTCMKKRRRSFDKKRHGRRGLRVARSRTDCGEAAIRMVTEKGFLDESIGTSDFRAIFWLQTLSITFCNFLLFRSEKIWHLWEDKRNTATRRHEGIRRIHGMFEGFSDATSPTSRPFRWSIVTSIWLLSRENFGGFLSGRAWESYVSVLSASQCTSVLGAQKIKNQWFF